jgi:uncharacterized protein with ATP-grasp and redox domains
MSNRHPTLPLPGPLRGLERPSFTHYSIVVRLPEIARRTLSENVFPAETISRIQQLIDDIPSGPIRLLEMPDAPDAAQWAGYIQPHVGQNWLEVPWFFAEEYFYQRILEAIGYYQHGSGAWHDPFAYQKRRGLETTAAEIEALSQRLAQLLDNDLMLQAIAQLLLIDLWGNQNDLSLWPATEQTEEQDRQPVALREAQEHILDNQLKSAVDHLTSLIPHKSRVDFLLDNAGFELACDLALADLLLSGGQAAQVVLHIKVQPVFVSDAMEKDILETLAFLSTQPHPAVRSLGARLDAHLKTSRIIFRADLFWTSPLAMWDAPNALLTELSQSGLLISKGDANYRRLLGDQHWPMDLPFHQVVDYLPTAVLALRTLKSEIALGIQSKQVPHNDPDWMSNGRWGLIQFSPAQPTGEKSRV